MSAPILIGLSGGVDSAVAAWALLEAGHSVEALFMKNWEEDDTDEYCAAARDLEDAQRVCDTLDLRLHTVNFAAEYWDRVFSLFLRDYAGGRTPNPDVLCNREIKFRSFVEHARTLGAQSIATGHYAGVRLQDHAQLLMADDTDKDQTYFLHLLDQQQLQTACFPLQHWIKADVRAMARRLDLPVHDKKDSTGLCFIGERRFQEFLARYIQRQPGMIVDEKGRVLGEHSGLAFYTLGQRGGLGIGGVAHALESPWYVLAKETRGNRLIVTQDRQHPALNVSEIFIEPPHWIAPTSPATSKLYARIRHRQPLQTCTLDLESTPARIQFAQPQWAPAPGQYAVFYEQDVCLGGGVICAG